MRRQSLLTWIAVFLFAAPALCLSQGTPAGCDRECLKGIANAYIAAMVAHDPGKAPLGSGFVLVENLKRVDTHAGLWASASALPGGFQIYVPDARAQQVGYLGVLQANGKPALLALRLKVEQRKVLEAEHIVIDSVSDSALRNLQQPRKAFAVVVPEPYRDSRGRLLYMAASYYDALDENNGSLAPFADDCVRIENGSQTSRNATPDDPSALMGSVGLGCAAQMNTQRFSYITTIDNRRVWIADEETGLAFGLSQFHHSSQQKVFRMIGIPGLESRTLDKPPYDTPFDMPAAHIFKIWGGQIHEIEAFGVRAPYRSPTGWEH